MPMLTNKHNLYYVPIMRTQLFDILTFYRSALINTIKKNKVPFLKQWKSKWIEFIFEALKQYV